MFAGQRTRKAFICVDSRALFACLLKISMWALADKKCPRKRFLNVLQNYTLWKYLPIIESESIRKSLSQTPPLCSRQNNGQLKWRRYGWSARRLYACFIVKSLILMTDVKTLLTSAVTPAILVHRYNLNTDTTRIFTKRASGAAGRYRRAGYQAGATPERVLIHKATHKFYLSERSMTKPCG